MNAFETLFETIKERKNQKTEGSYTCYLFESGLDKILKKCGEESAEMIIAAKNKDNDELKNEIGDLFYHIFVLMQENGVEFSEIEAVLDARARKTGNLKTFHNTDKNT